MPLQSLHPRHRALATIAPLLALLAMCLPSRAAELELNTSATKLIQQFCLDCHAGKSAEAKLDLEQMVATRSLATHFPKWRMVATKLEQGEMPPAEADQPTEAQRRQLSLQLGVALREVTERHAGEPGRVVLRRLTAAEQNYTIRDLTGLNLDLAPDIADAVGGEGFSNVGFVQFVQASTLEQYLKAAKGVAEHAVIGAGPLQFYQDPGQTGFELSAIHRIQAIYRQYGFRTAAGEGGEPFGLDHYPKAFFAAWQYRHRQALGIPNITFADLAARHGLTGRFVAHIWDVLSQESPTFPSSEIVARWRELPTPDRSDTEVEDAAALACDELYAFLNTWYRRLGTANDDEAAPVFIDGSVRARKQEAILVRILWPEESEIATVLMKVGAADSAADRTASVVWKNPRIRFRTLERRLEEEQPLKDVLDGRTRRKLGYGRHPNGTAISASDFAITGGSPVKFDIRLPEGMRSAELLMDAQFDATAGVDRVVRCAVSAGELGARGKVISALLADPSSDTYKDWLGGVMSFARSLPQISHREPAPSDRDPIPPPFDNTYNEPERDHFHYKVKYFRDDAFISYFVLDDAARTRLDQAWADLLSSFEYHDIFLQFVATKFGFQVEGGIAGLSQDWIDQLPEAARGHVQRLHAEYTAVHEALRSAQRGHVDDVIQLAGRAWRRPLADEEQERLRSYYQTLRRDLELDHVKAIRALLTRTLIAPDFIYRTERPLDGSNDVPLSDWELASRLSYFLWSSLPDDELRRAAAAGELADSAQLARQADRLVRDAKSRRLSAEFFGQWLGFYRFDRYRGVDSERFPEFTDRLKSSMYQEAVTFFDYLIRNDRPLREILFADYTFLDSALGEHYGVDSDRLSDAAFSRVDGVRRHQRGGLFGLGAVLTATSAPLRTSAVKRGDWILRRVVGTPVPPPPADAGSIPADDVLSDGLTVRERLEAHRQDASCRNCHVRIDPLGFALEHYDAIGRWREEYRGGQPIDASGVLQDGTRIDGPDGLRDYLEANEPQFFRLLCTKLLGYGLGRRASVADMHLIEEISADLQAGGNFSQMVEKIVTSRQFRYHQGRAK